MISASYIPAPRTELGKPLPQCVEMHSFSFWGKGVLVQLSAALYFSATEGVALEVVAAAFSFPHCLYSPCSQGAELFQTGWFGPWRRTGEERDERWLLA